MPGTSDALQIESLLIDTHFIGSLPHRRHELFLPESILDTQCVHVVCQTRAAAVQQQRGAPGQVHDGVQAEFLQLPIEPLEGLDDSRSVEYAVVLLPSL